MYRSVDIYWSSDVSPLAFPVPFHIHHGCFRRLNSSGKVSITMAWDQKGNLSLAEQSNFESRFPTHKRTPASHQRPRPLQYSRGDRSGVPVPLLCPRHSRHLGSSWEEQRVWLIERNTHTYICASFYCLCFSQDKLDRLNRQYYAPCDPDCKSQFIFPSIMLVCT